MILRRALPSFSLCLALLAQAQSGQAQPKHTPEADDKRTSDSAVDTSAAAFPSLSRAIALARDHAPQVITARGMTNVAQSSQIGARLSPLTNPYLEVFADRGTTGTRDLTIAANLWLPIELGGQRSLRIAESDAWIAWAGTNLEAARAFAASEAIRAYGTALVAAERARIGENILATARSESALYQARLDAKDATVLDARLANLEVSRNQSMLTEARADLSRALADLARLTGETSIAPPDASVSVDPPAPKTDASSTTSIDRAVEGSPFVRSSAREAEFRQREGARLGRDSHAPVNFILSAGRGDLGETRLGAGLAWTFPMLRTNQGEQARAEAERARALAENETQRRAMTATLRGLYTELTQTRAAADEMSTTAEVEAQALVDAAVEMQRAGKSEYLRVLMMRRDLAMLRTRRLELIKRAWSITADITAVTGDAP
ncbi:MAG: TolC family protein [Polyangiaceae bacterium]